MRWTWCTDSTPTHPADTREPRRARYGWIVDAILARSTQPRAMMPPQKMAWPRSRNIAHLLASAQPLPRGTLRHPNGVRTVSKPREGDERARRRRLTATD